MVRITVTFCAVALWLMCDIVPGVKAIPDSEIDAAIEKVPELAFLDKGSAFAIFDQDTHEVLTGNVGELNKRTSYGYGYDDCLIKLLKKNKAYGWCQSYCGNQKPTTVTKIACVTKTKTICDNGRFGHGSDCRPITKTEVLKATDTEVATWTEIQVINQTTTVAADETITSTVDITETVVITLTETVSSTSTIQIPTMSAQPLPRRSYNAKIPSYLRDYRPREISSACSKLLPPRPTKTVTHTRTKTKSHWTVAPRTTTTKTYVVTRTTTDSSTVSSTTVATVTTTPTVSVTNTIPMTITETQTSTAVVSVCAQQTNGISGIAVAPPGGLRGSNAGTIADCCLACYNAPGCTGWAFLGTNFCFYATGSPPNSGTPSPMCPSGLGRNSLGTGGPSGLAGGPGPCAA